MKENLIEVSNAREIAVLAIMFAFKSAIKLGWITEVRGNAIFDLATEIENAIEKALETGNDWVSCPKDLITQLAKLEELAQLRKDEIKGEKS